MKSWPAVSVTREGRGNGAFELDAGEVVEGETDGLFECVLRVFFQSAPMTGEGFHGGIEVVFIDGVAAGGGEQGALGGVFEGEFRTREE